MLHEILHQIIFIQPTRESIFKKEFKIAMVNEPSVFEPLKFYCIFLEIDHEKEKKTIFYVPKNIIFTD